MKEYLISQFIDNELNLDEKVNFVETVHDSRTFAMEVIDFLKQEKLLTSELEPWVATQPPRPVAAFSWSEFRRSCWQPLAGFAAAMILVAMLLPLYQPEGTAVLSEHRFVVYLPSASEPKIIGTFTGWKPRPMEKIGTSGYWTLTLMVPEGEHRYSYMMGNNTPIADPTVATREKDDFGGENSVITIRQPHVPLS